MLQDCARSGALPWVAMCARASDRPESGGHSVSECCAVLMNLGVCKKMDLVGLGLLGIWPSGLQILVVAAACSHGMIEPEE